MGIEVRLRLEKVIPEDAIVPELAAETKGAAIKELVTALVDAGMLARNRVKEVSQAVLERENLGSTGIGKGIAVPHVKLPFVKEPVGAMGKSAKGIDFSSLDGSLTHTVFLFISPTDPPDKHVALMSRFVTLIRKPDFVKFLAQTEGRRQLHDFLVEVDEW
jgi:mannitol/fructose-specific phosphotransferase system IIA component (Ntr-type)